MVKVNVSKLSNSKAFFENKISKFLQPMKVKVLKLSNSKALWRTEYQNFFNHGEVKGIQTEQF